MVGMNACAAGCALQPLLHWFGEHSCWKFGQFASAIFEDRPVRVIPFGFACLLLVLRALPLAVTALDFWPQPVDELGSNSVGVSAQLLFDFVECESLSRQRPHDTSKGFAALSFRSALSDQLVKVEVEPEPLGILPVAASVLY